MLVTPRSAVFLVLCASTSVACIYEDEPPRRFVPDPPSARAPSGEGTSGAETTAPPSGSSSPMLVEIDADQTMTAKPGDGVGVFVEYAKGGHWHLWWTCDTALTRQRCDFAVSATVNDGNLTNIDPSALPGGAVASSSASRLEAKSVTTTEVHGVRFDTNPGSVITVEASVGGLKDGAFLFFVQDGKVNGGFSGKLTNPLRLQGNAA